MEKGMVSEDGRRWNLVPKTAQIQKVPESPS